MVNIGTRARARESIPLNKQPQEALNNPETQSPIFTECSPSMVGQKVAKEKKKTDGLPIGTQAKLIGAAQISNDKGRPINTLLTVSWDALRHYDNTNHLFAKPIIERIAYIVELHRKWHFARYGGNFQFLWVREANADSNEHWHLAFHLPNGEQEALKNYVSNLLREPALPKPRSKSEGKTEGEFAYSLWGSWHLAGDTRPELAGYYLAAYLGKGEPSQRIFHGKPVNNTKKPVRGKDFGGRERYGKYDMPQGEIIGTIALKYRFGIARHLKSGIRLNRKRFEMGFPLIDT